MKLSYLLENLELINKLLEKAKKKYGKITMPVGIKKWEDSVTIVDGKTFLWFNDKTGSTRVEKE